MKKFSLVAIRVIRRSVGAVVFESDRLVHTELRHLSSEQAKAQVSAAGFIHWILYAFEADSAALEPVPEGPDTRRGILHQMIVDVLRSEGVSVWTCGKEELFETFAVPPLTTRRELRSIASSFWPVIDDDSGLLLEAAALGLHVQTQRLFDS